MSTPPDSELSAQLNRASASTPEPATRELDPDNPPWGFLQAFLTWLASVGLIIFIPLICTLPYLATHYREGLTQEALLKDKTYILFMVAGFLPAHILTLILAWAVASRLGKVSPIKSLGLSWPPNFGMWKSTGLAILLLATTVAILYNFGGQETELERILRSSRAATLIMAFLATVTAPAMEEIIYRGLLYSALQRFAGPLISIVLVTSIFAGLHVWQYWPNFAAISAISLLSLVLTTVRARTGRLLPCYVIHLVFNGIQSIILVGDPYLRSLFHWWRSDAASAFVNSLFSTF